MVFDKVMANEEFTTEETLQMASIIHEEWLKRNDWVYDPNYGDPRLAVSFEQLSKEEQDKDIAQLAPAIAKVEAYMMGKVDVIEICDKYGLGSNKKSK